MQEVNDNDLEPDANATPVAAIIGAESSGNPNAVSKKGARGLMQVMPANATAAGIPPDKLFDPNTNVQLGSKLWQENYKRFGDRRKATAAYVWGPGNVALHPDESKWPKEVSSYVDKVEGPTQQQKLPKGAQEVSDDDLAPDTGPPQQFGENDREYQARQAAAAFEQQRAASGQTVPQGIPTAEQEALQTPKESLVGEVQQHPYATAGVIGALTPPGWAVDALGVAAPLVGVAEQEAYMGMADLGMKIAGPSHPYVGLGIGALGTALGGGAMSLTTGVGRAAKEARVAAEQAQKDFWEAAQKGATEQEAKNATERAEAAEKVAKEAKARHEAIQKAYGEQAAENLKTTTPAHNTAATKLQAYADQLRNHAEQIEKHGPAAEEIARKQVAEEEAGRQRAATLGRTPEETAKATTPKRVQAARAPRGIADLSTVEVNEMASTIVPDADGNWPDPTQFALDHDLTPSAAKQILKNYREYLEKKTRYENENGRPLTVKEVAEDEAARHRGGVAPEETAVATTPKRVQATTTQKAKLPDIEVEDVKDDFVQEQLGAVKKGKPGLSVEESGTLKPDSIIYRGPDGNAVGVLTHAEGYGPDNKLHRYVENFAIDKSKGVLAARAAKALADKAKEMGIDPGTTMSPDAARFLQKYADQQTENASVSVPSPEQLERTRNFRNSFFNVRSRLFGRGAEQGHYGRQYQEFENKYGDLKVETQPALRDTLDKWEGVLEEQQPSGEPPSAIKKLIGNAAALGGNPETDSFEAGRVSEVIAGRSTPGVNSRFTKLMDDHVKKFGQAITPEQTRDYAIQALGGNTTKAATVTQLRALRRDAQRFADSATNPRDARIANEIAASAAKDYEHAAGLPEEEVAKLHNLNEQYAHDISAWSSDVSSKVMGDREPVNVIDHLVKDPDLMDSFASNANDAEKGHMRDAIADWANTNHYSIAQVAQKVGQSNMEKLGFNLPRKAWMEMEPREIQLGEILRSNPMAQHVIGNAFADEMKSYEARTNGALRRNGIKIAEDLGPMGKPLADAMRNAVTPEQVRAIAQKIASMDPKEVAAQFAKGLQTPQSAAYEKYLEIAQKGSPARQAFQQQVAEAPGKVAQAAAAAPEKAGVLTRPEAARKSLMEAKPGKFEDRMRQWSTFRLMFSTEMILGMGVLTGRIPPYWLAGGVLGGAMKVPLMIRGATRAALSNPAVADFVWKAVENPHNYRVAGRSAALALQAIAEQKAREQQMKEQEQQDNQ